MTCASEATVDYANDDACLTIPDLVPKTLVGKLVGVGAEVRELSSHVVDQHQHQLNTHGKGGSIHAPHIEAPHASSEPPRTAPTPYPPPGAPGLQEPFVAKENGGNNPKRGAERLEGTEAAAKIARRAPPPTGEALCAGDDPLPALEGYVRPLNDSGGVGIRRTMLVSYYRRGRLLTPRPRACVAGPTEIEGDPTFLSYEVRSRAWCTLGHAIVAFEDTSAYSVPAGVNFTGLLFWFTRVRSHLASGLGESPEEPGFDPQSARFIYDVRKVRVCPCARVPVRPCARALVRPCARAPVHRRSPFAGHRPLRGGRPPHRRR